MKTWKKIGLILLGAVVLLFGYVCLWMYGVFIPNPRMPEVRHAKFPFRIELEYKGKRYVANDAVVCDYDGVGVAGYSTRKYRRWKESLTSGREYETAIPMVVLLEIEDFLLQYFTGEAEYYMDKSYLDLEDEDIYKDGIPWSLEGPSIYIENKKTVDQDGLNFDFISTDEQQMPRLKEVLKNLGVKIISIEQTPPINNKLLPKK